MASPGLSSWVSGAGGALEKTDYFEGTKTVNNRIYALAGKYIYRVHTYSAVHTVQCSAVQCSAVIGTMDTEMYQKHLSVLFPGFRVITGFQLMKVNIISFLEIFSKTKKDYLFVKFLYAINNSWLKSP